MREYFFHFFKSIFQIDKINKCKGPTNKIHLTYKIISMNRVLFEFGGKYYCQLSNVTG